MTDYVDVDVHMKINSIRPVVNGILLFKCIRSITLIFDLEVLGHNLLTIVDYVRVHVKMKFIPPTLCEVS